ncbi:hypothetical protein [Roseivirga sp.]|uniref:hypothetical protein n=1 Tax=Roseivirga sp. TaxID=1964215 RepID=UPI003B8D9C0C
MNRLLILLIFLFSSILTYGQIDEIDEPSVENSTIGVQTGILGIWLYREVKIKESFAIRTEIGFEGELFGGINFDGVQYVFSPILSFEPRWYYNLEKRDALDKNTKSNSANYLSFRTSLSPNWFEITNVNNLFPVNQLTLLPTWGIRRQVGQKWNYELGIGIGYQYTFHKEIVNVGEAILQLNLRFGYRIL